MKIRLCFIWFFKQFYFFNNHVSERVYFRSMKSNFIYKLFRNQLWNQFFHGTTCPFSSYNFYHFSSYCPNLRCFYIGSFFILIPFFSRKCYSKYSKKIPVFSFYVGVYFNHSLPFSDVRAEFISCDFHSIESCQAAFCVKIIASKYQFFYAMIPLSCLYLLNLLYNFYF